MYEVQLTGTREHFAQLAELLLYACQENNYFNIKEVITLAIRFDNDYGCDVMIRDPNTWEAINFHTLSHMND